MQLYEITMIKMTCQSHTDSKQAGTKGQSVWVKIMGLVYAFAKGFCAQRWKNLALCSVLWSSAHHVASSGRDQASTALHWECSMQGSISISQLVGQGLFV